MGKRVKRMVTEMSPVLPGSLTDKLRLLSDIVFIPLEEGVAVDGLGSLEVIRGVLAQTLLPELIERLDGTRTLGELIGELTEIPEEYVRTIVSLLMDWRLLRAADNAESSTEFDRTSLAFIRRHRVKAGFDPHCRETCSRFGNISVCLATSVGMVRYAEILREQLERMGLANVQIVQSGQILDSDLSTQAIIVVLDLVAADAQLRFEAAEAKRSWLLVTLDKNAKYGDIGPLFTTDPDTCSDCFEQVYWPVHATGSGHPLSHEQMACWIGLVAIEIFYILSFPELSIGARRFRRIQFQDWSTQNLDYPRIPKCAKCQSPSSLDRSGRNLSDDQINTATVFEEYVGLTSKSVLALQTINGFARSERRASTEPKEFTIFKQIPLLRGNFQLAANTLKTLQGKRSWFCRSRASLDKLAAILSLTAGIRQYDGETVRRWAANAGNLGSVELFVANLAIEGLEPGVFFYQANTHTLASFEHRADLEVSEFMARVLRRSRDELPAALVLFTGAIHRLVRKYGSFAYRLINLDAGVAIGQMHLATRALGLHSKTTQSYADDLIVTQLNLTPQEELPTGAVELSANWLQPACPVGQLQAPSTSPKGWRPACEFGGVDLDEITKRVMEESIARESDLTESWATTNSGRTDDLSGFPIVSLPRPTRHGLSVGNVLIRRRSVRRFATIPVSLEVLATALSCAEKADSRERSRLDISLDFIVLPSRIENLKPAVYQYSGKENALRELRGPLSQIELASLFVQEEFTEAPVVIWLVGDLEAACTREGTIGHRNLLRRAGVAGYAIWSASLSLDMSGSIIAGVVPGAARKLLGFDGLRRASLVAIALGYSDIKQKRTD